MSSPPLSPVSSPNLPPQNPPGIPPIALAPATPTVPATPAATTSNSNATATPNPTGTPGVVPATPLSLTMGTPSRRTSVPRSGMTPSRATVPQTPGTPLSDFGSDAGG
eukprot:CAMPEP_0182477396 /NCGR_PEP_ID=MMETSP1319-20130603/30805_1 /TAXON_ID=172717 /ORGANISM="Bolidomonas pacifica, Strain RCC208" /LENGTH=107 /DNA_ID=CAMNT_0024678615 /DNA_START=104 /DNA_END=424 /DNA_ORIENTATION=+